MLADDETVQMHATGSGLGNLGRLLREGQTPAKTVELDVLDDASAARYFERDERYDTVLNLEPGTAGLPRVRAGAGAVGRAFPRRARDRQSPCARFRTTNGSGTSASMPRRARC